MSEQKSSPKIENISWGSVTVSGFSTPYKDAKLYPGGSREWNWNETGTSHSPGIQTEDVKELVENGAEVVIIGRGMNQRLQVKQQTLDWLKEQQVETEIYQTEKAAERYNNLAESTKVGALIHSTC